MPIATNEEPTKGVGEFENRYIQRRCHYKGDVTGNLEVGTIMGPNRLHEMQTVIRVEYNADTNMSTAYFDFTRITDYPQPEVTG